MANDSESYTKSMEHGVFICYRRAAGFVARAVKQHLETYGYQCFLDVENLQGGQFDSAIFNEINRRKHFLIIVGKDTFASEPTATDWMLEEMRVAVETARNIVPLLLDNEAALELSRINQPGLDSLRTLNGLAINHAFFSESMERLRREFLPNTARDEEDRKLAQAYVREASAVASREGSTRDSQRKQLQLLDQALNIAPRDGEIRFLRACLNERLDRREHALLDLQACIEMGHRIEDVYVKRGEFRTVWKEFDQALEDFTKCLALNPRNIDALTARSLCYILIKNSGGAIQDLSRIIETDPTNLEARAWRGRELAELGQLHEALVDLNAAIEAQYGDPRTYAARARILAELGQEREALEDYETALARSASIDRSSDRLFFLRIEGVRKAALHLRRQEAAQAVGVLTPIIAEIEALGDTLLFGELYKLRAKAWRALGKNRRAARDEATAKEIDSQFLQELTRERAPD